MIDVLPTVLAHQGGWDETLFVLAPVIIYALLLLLARRRVGDLEQEAAEHRETEDDPTTE